MKIKRDRRRLMKSNPVYSNAFDRGGQVEKMLLKEEKEVIKLKFFSGKKDATLLAE